MLASILIGGLIGTAIGIDAAMNRLGMYVKKRFLKSDDSTSMEGLIMLSILQITGAMAILGPIQAAFGNDDLLLLKVFSTRFLLLYLVPFTVLVSPLWV